MGRDQRCDETDGQPASGDVRQGRDLYFVSRRAGHGVYRLQLDEALRCEGREPR